MTSVAQQAAVKQVVDGSKAYFRIDPALLRGDLDTLFAASANAKQQLENLSWATVLGNGTNPGVDVDFYGYEVSGLGAVTTSGTFEGDSLVLNKDAEIAGRLEVVGAATIGDSLWVEGAVVLSDSLRVVRAVAVGSRLHVSGVSAFGDSVHVVGNVDLDALFHVDGAASFGSEVDISGKLSVQDSVSFASALEVEGATSFGDSLIIEGGTAMLAGANVSGVLVADSIALGKVLNAQIRDLANHDTDGLTEGATNLYFTDSRAQDAFTSGTGVTLNAGEISIGQSVGTTDDVSFGGIAATATVTADSLSVTDVINGQVSSLGNHDTDGLTEGAANLYFTDSRARDAFTSGTGVTLNAGEISIGQDVSTTSDVTFDELSASSLQSSGALTVTGVTTLKDSLVSGESGFVMRSASDFSLQALDGDFEILGEEGPDGSPAIRMLFADSNYFNHANENNQSFLEIDGEWDMKLHVDNDAGIEMYYGNGGKKSELFFYGDSMVFEQGDVYIANDLILNDLSASATVTADSLSVTDVINGQVSSLGNHDTDGLTEGATNLYFTDSRAQDAFTSGTGVTLNAGEISIGQSVGTTDDVKFAGIEATGTVTAESLVVTNVINGQVSSLGNHDTDGLTEGFTNRYYTDARARSAFSSGTGVTLIEGEISIGQDVSTTSDVTFDELSASSLQSSGALTVTGVTTLKDSLVSGESGFVMRSASDFSLQALNGDFEILGEVSSGDSPAIRMLFADSNYFNHANENNQSFLEVDGWWDMKLHVDNAAGIEMRYGNNDKKSELFFYGDSMVFEQGDVYIANDLILNDLSASATVTADSLSVTDVINGQVSSLANHSTDDLAEGSTHLYLTPAERASLAALEAMAHAIDSLSCTWLKYQGHVYELILIGDQCWFAENLRSENYANGEAILAGFDNQQWFNTSFGATAAYGDDESNVEAYGRLYNHYAVADSRGLCPNGWHVPTSNEWTTLANYLAPGEGNALKSSGSDLPIWNGNNSSGFSALPGGFRSIAGGYSGLGTTGFWWTRSFDEWEDPVMRILVSGDSAIDGYGMPSKFGFSVRCLRD